MAKNPFVAVLIVALLLVIAFAGCMGGKSEQRSRSNPVRLGGAGGAFVDGSTETALEWHAEDCTLTSAVLLYNKGATQKTGEYVVADLRSDYPDVLIGSIGPTVGPIMGSFFSLLRCNGVSPLGGSFTLTFRSIRVEPPSWDVGTNASLHSTIGWFATDNEELAAILRERTNLTVRELIAAGSDPMTDTAHRMYFDVPAGQDIDAVFARRVEADPPRPVYRFWADRPELQDSGGTQFVPVDITLAAKNVVSTGRFEQGFIMGRYDLAPPPLFTAVGQSTMGNVTVLEDVRIRFSEPGEHLLTRTWLSDLPL